MQREKPVIDLSGGQYDDLEQKLSQTLGIKIMLVQGWQPSEAEQFAQGKIGIIFAGATSEDVDQAREEKMDELESQQQSRPERLRAHIAMRDKDLAASMTENELKSLLVVNHVTLRSGNCEPERAVIIFDPLDRIPSGISALFGCQTFSNAWYDAGKHDYKHSSVGILDFFENDDIAANDWRAYQTLIDVRYALMNQNEYNNLDRGWYYEPAYYKVCSLETDDAKLEKKYEKMDGKECYQRLWAEPFIDDLYYENYGLKDPKIVEKLTLTQAIADLSSRNPVATFMRLGRNKSDSFMDDEEIHTFQRELKERLQEAVEKKAEDSKRSWLVEQALYDWRILLPIFREVYEQDQSTGVKRAYLDTVMEGLQRYFPTLTNGAVPALNPDNEPPRTLEEYKKPGGSPGPTPPLPPSPPGPA